MPNETIRRMRRVPFLSYLSADALRLLSFSGETQILRMNEVLFEEGTLSKGGYFLLQGTLALEQKGRVIRRVEMDSLIGELALITKTSHPVTAVALSACTLLYMPRSLFARVLQEFPDDALNLKTRLTENTTYLSHDLAKLEAYFRL